MTFIWHFYKYAHKSNILANTLDDLCNACRYLMPHISTIRLPQTLMICYPISSIYPSVFSDNPSCSQLTKVPQHNQSKLNQKPY